MRKNKFILSSKRSQSSFQYKQKQEQQNNHPLVQNKIYFPASYNEKFMPYKIQIANNKHKKSDLTINASTLYSISQKVNSKEKSKKRSSFCRQNKFEIIRDENKNLLSFNSKDLIKYNTLQLQNLPGIYCTTSGKTIYRSKNIKSSKKLMLKNKIDAKQKPQVRRNMSVRNQQSLQLSIQKSKSNKQNMVKLNQKGLKLYQTYFSSRHNLRSNSLRPLKKYDSFEQTSQNAEYPEDILCEQIIQQELYTKSDNQQQQLFF